MIKVPIIKALGSASLDAYEACPATACYWVDKESKPKTTFGQWYGIFVHRFIEYSMVKGRDAALQYIRSKRMATVIKCCERIDVDSIPRGDVEVAMAHDVVRDTGRRLQAKLGSFGLDVGSEQYGRADLLITEAERPHVVDYKCGMQEGDPLTSTQLLGLAASTRALYGASEVDISLVGVLSTGELRWFTATVTDQVHRDFLNRSRRIQLRVLQDRQRLENGIEPEYRAGKHCDCCDLKPICPEHAH